MALSLVRKKAGSGGAMINAEAIQQALKLTASDRTGTAAQYLSKMARQICTNLGVQDKPAVKEVLGILDTHAKNVTAAYNASGCTWGGKDKPPTAGEISFANVQERLIQAAEAGLDNIKEKMRVEFQFALGSGEQDGALLRGHREIPKEESAKAIEAEASGPDVTTEVSAGGGARGANG